MDKANHTVQRRRYTIHLNLLKRVFQPVCNGDERRRITQRWIGEGHEAQLVGVAGTGQNTRTFPGLVGVSDVFDVALERLHDGERLHLNDVVDRRIDGRLLSALLHEEKHAQKGRANQNGGEVIEDRGHGGERERRAWCSSVRTLCDRGAAVLNPANTWSKSNLFDPGRRTYGPTLNISRSLGRAARSFGLPRLASVLNAGWHEARSAYPNKKRRDPEQPRALYRRSCTATYESRKCRVSAGTEDRTPASY